METHAACTVKYLFDEPSVLGPIHLDTVNSILIICLGAYMIARLRKAPHRRQRSPIPTATGGK